MNSILKDMIKGYDLKQDSEINIAKEIMQKICLYAISRTNFFTKIAFIGDTCLRLFYGLDRFNEDLDFTFRKFKQVDSQLAKDDVIEFINDKRKIEIWSSEFFCDVSDQYLK